jgi:hypothetical protein
MRLPGRWVGACVILTAIVSACSQGGTVTRYAACTPSDTCPSQTVCEEPTQNGSVGTIPTICTWSCGDIASGSANSCPNDATGTPGACVSLQGNVADYGFCFQTCPIGTCPEGETCMQTTTYDFDEMTSICVPVGN